jgi:hypothetical protein
MCLTYSAKWLRRSQEASRKQDNNRVCVFDSTTTFIPGVFHDLFRSTRSSYGAQRLGRGHAGSAGVGGDGERSRRENCAAVLCDGHGQRDVVAESEARDRRVELVPKTEGRAFEFGKSTEPLRPFREQRRGLTTESFQWWQPVGCVENRRGTNRAALAIITV